MEDSVLSRLKYVTRLKLSKIFNRSFLPPIEVLFTLTNRCNLRCIMCNFHNFPMDIADELSTKNVTSMIAQIADLRIKNVVLSGGEPLLREDLFEIIHYAFSLGIDTTLLTNGTIMNEAIINKINSSGLNSICLSIDGLEEKHDYIRGEGAFKKSMYFIKMVSERCPSVSLNITTTIMDCNLEDIPRLLQLWEKMKIKIKVSFQPVIPDNTDWNIKEKGNSLWVPEHRLALLDKIIDETVAFKKKNDIIANDYYFLELIKHYFKEDLHKMKRKAHCYEGFKRFTITAGGRIWICGTEMKSSIIEKGLKRCWNSPEVRKKRQQMLKCKKLCLQACSF